MGEMTTLSTSLSSIPAFVIQIRLLYAYGNANEHWSFFHYANQLLPSLVRRNENAARRYISRAQNTSLPIAVWDKKAKYDLFSLERF